MSKKNPEKYSGYPVLGALEQTGAFDSLGETGFVQALQGLVADEGRVIPPKIYIEYSKLFAQQEEKGLSQRKVKKMLRRAIKAAGLDPASVERKRIDSIEELAILLAEAEETNKKIIIYISPFEVVGLKRTAEGYIFTGKRVLRIQRPLKSVAEVFKFLNTVNPGKTKTPKNVMIIS